MIRPRRAIEKRSPHSRPTRRAGEAGYAYLMALGIILAVIIGSQVVMENLVTQGRRQREEETIWRGKQWARAIRLYYRKTGHYPQSIDDLEMGVPDVHFLRAAAIKDPMDPDEGSWRLIYVNSTGQIIGSVRYATLQQMALLDLNNGQMPQGSLLPGAVSASSMSSTFGNSASSVFNDSNSNSSDSNAPNAPGANGNSGAAGPGGPTSVGGSDSQGSQGVSPRGNDTSSQSPPGSTDNSSSDNSSGNSPGLGASPSTGSNDTSAFGQGQSAGTFGSSNSFGQNANANPLAQVMQLQPTGPVDGPVIGAFITGVGIPTAIDQKSIRVYHGGKKYKDWEFIWNPLEDQAQALQQGLGAAQAGGGLLAPQGQNNGSSSSPFGNSFGNGSSNPMGAPPSGPGASSPQGPNL